MLNSQTKMSERQTRVANLYAEIKQALMSSPFAGEIKWQQQVRFDEISESDFLRESAWVILSCGMRESVVRAKFPSISGVFFAWESAGKIVRNSETCIKRAMKYFGHARKIDAIVKIAHCVYREGFAMVLAAMEKDGVDYIRQFPYMGPATSYHLAKNLGLDVVKPDRHLKRMASASGYATPAELCSDIAAMVSDPVSVVDLVLWRFATLVPEYTYLFTLAANT